MSEPLTAGDAPELADSPTTVSPWMTVEQAADYANYHYETIRRLCVEYQRRNDHGLKCSQRKAGGHYRIHRDDLDRWIAGLAPTRGVRRFASV